MIKSTFKLTLTHDAKLVSIFNTPCEKTEKAGDKLTSYFQATPPMCCYLFAIVIGTFVSVSGKTKRNLPIEIWATPDKKDYMPYALTECISYVEWYEDFTQVNFPLPRLAVCAVPDFLMGAMENFGLIIARETASLASKEKSSTAAIIRAMMVNCHEIAHQWFGNGVSPAWWDNIWLNEVFISFDNSFLFYFKNYIRFINL